MSFVGILGLRGEEVLSPGMRARHWSSGGKGEGRKVDSSCRSLAGGKKIRLYHYKRRTALLTLLPRKGEKGGGRKKKGGGDKFLGADGSCDVNNKGEGSLSTLSPICGPWEGGGEKREGGGGDTSDNSLAT